MLSFSKISFFTHSHTKLSLFLSLSLSLLLSVPLFIYLSLSLSLHLSLPLSLHAGRLLMRKPILLWWNRHRQCDSPLCPTCPNNILKIIKNKDQGHGKHTSVARSCDSKRINEIWRGFTWGHTFEIVLFPAFTRLPGNRNVLGNFLLERPCATWKYGLVDIRRGFAKLYI